MAVVNPQQRISYSYWKRQVGGVPSAGGDRIRSAKP